MKLVMLIAKFLKGVYQGLAHCIAAGVVAVSNEKIPVALAKKCVYLGTAFVVMGACIFAPLFVIDMGLICVYLFIITTLIDVVIDFIALFATTPDVEQQ